MHFAIVEVYLHVFNAVASQNAFSAGSFDTFFHRGDEGTIHVLPHQRLGKLDTFSTLFGLYAHPNFCKLASAARLFLVAIFCFSFALNGFAEGDLGFNQVKIDFVFLTNFFRHHFHVEVSLAGDYCLVQLRINHIEEGWVFRVDLSQTNGHFFFFTFCLESKSRMDIGAREGYGGQGYRFFGKREGITCMGVFEFHHGTNITANQLGGCGTVFPVEEKELCNTLGRIGMCVH